LREEEVPQHLDEPGPSNDLQNSASEASLDRSFYSLPSPFHQEMEVIFAQHPTLVRVSNGGISILDKSQFPGKIKTNVRSFMKE
jgi:hypothetical protein